MTVLEITFELKLTAGAEEQYRRFPNHGFHRIVSMLKWMCGRSERIGEVKVKEKSYQKE